MMEQETNDRGLINHSAWSVGDPNRNLLSRCNNHQGAMCEII
jgi:hypothetical protein